MSSAQTMIRSASWPGAMLPVLESSPAVRAPWRVANSRTSAAVVPEDQIPLTRNEIAHLLSSMLIYPAHDTEHRIRRSRWRRRHQHRAWICHYQRQAAQDQ